jgi:hypothetical protein
VGRNEALEVVRVEKHKIVARTSAGVERDLTARQAKCFEVYERRGLAVAPNDRLVLTGNRREKGFRATNGETVTVTAHRSQGKSVDAVVISGEAMKRELFYVAASRGRESVTVVTSDKSLLAETVGRSGERQSASELVRKMGQNQPRTKRMGMQRGAQRGPVAAREMAKQAAWREREPERKMPAKEQEVRRERPVRDREVERGRDYGFSR